MKFNIEIELDWIGEDSTLDESIKNQIIETIVNNLSESVQKNITEKVIDKMEKSVEKLVTKTYTQVINQKIEITNEWGETKKKYTGVKDMIKNRFDEWLLEKVDKNGKPTNSNYSESYTRMNYFIDCQLNSFSKKFTEETVKEMRAKLESTLTNDMKELLGSQMMDVIGVKELLNNAKQKAIKS